VNIAAKTELNLPHSSKLHVFLANVPEFVKSGRYSCSLRLSRLLIGNTADGCVQAAFFA
jgi:hypothetical protein